MRLTRASAITQRWRTPSRPGRRQRKQPSKMRKHGVVRFPIGYASPNSDTYHRVFAKLSHRKSIATIHPCDSRARSTCSTFPIDSHALSSTTSILNVSQSARLQDRQCGHHGCLQRRLSCPGGEETTPIHEQVWRQRDYPRCYYRLMPGKRCRRRAGIYLRLEEERGR